jgi:hypothetical protein
VNALEAYASFGRTRVVFVEPNGAEHVVVLDGAVPPGEAAEVALHLLMEWKQAGDAVFEEPLTHKQAGR